MNGAVCIVKGADLDHVGVRLGVSILLNKVTNDVANSGVFYCDGCKLLSFENFLVCYINKYNLMS